MSSPGPCETFRMEDRALNREPGKQWAWFIPYVSTGVATVVARHVEAPRVVHLSIGVAAGVLWQLLNRRDLASRLTFPAVLISVGVVAMLVSGSAFEWDDMNTAGLLWIGVVLGLIYTEHVQRWWDRTAWRRELTTEPSRTEVSR
jgi:hypothetical protein